MSNNTATAEKKTITYRFEYVTHCEMCGHESREHRLLGQRLNKSQGMWPHNKSGISVSVMKCNQCSLIYSHPQPVPLNIQDHYGVPPEQYWQPSYFNWTPAYFADEMQTVKRLLPFSPGMKALDIGAGIGKGMISMEKAGFDAYGFEPSKPFYERALSRMQISPDKIRLGMIEEMEYEADSFDFVSFGAVFEHVYHPYDCLKKALYWLKPGGILHIEVPSSDYLIPKLLNFYYKLIGTSYVTNLSPMHEPFHLYEFGLASFQKLSARLQYSIVEHNYFAGEVPFFPRVLHPVLKKIMNATDRGMQLTVWLKK